MSVNKEKNVPQLVEKYRREFPGVERRFLRKLIRLENKIENPSELKKLDRYLRKAFKNEEKKPSQQIVEDEFFDVLRKSLWLPKEERLRIVKQTYMKIQDRVRKELT